MLEVIGSLLGSNGFIPHGHCYLWQLNLVWLHATSDALIAIAYYSIPFTLLYFARERKDLPFHGIFLLFSSFILACGTTHLLEIWTLWHPIYWFSGSIKLITAVVSLYTAGALVPLVPKALSLRSPVQLELINQRLEHEIAERKQVEKSLRESEARYRAIVEDQTEMICRFLPDGTLTFVNGAYCRYFERTQADLIGHNFKPIVFSEDKEPIEQQLKTLSPANPVVTVTNRIVRPSGEVRLNEWTNRIILDPQSDFVEVQAVGRDITEVQQTRQLQAAIKEKDVLLQEIHHRVKNNLQMIYSLLRLQARKVSDPEASEILLDSQNRVKSIAMIHEKLYRVEDLSEIDLKQYISTLVASLFSSYNRDANLVELSVEVEPVFLDIDSAIPCGLIINELMTNSLKYAFPEGKKGKVGIMLHADADDRISMVIFDTGVGFTLTEEPSKNGKLGLNLVRDLVKQLKGTIEITSQEGTLIKITFPRSRV